MSEEGEGYAHQDWKPVVIRSTYAAKIAKKDKQNPAGTAEFRKLDEGGAIPQLNKISVADSKMLIEARNAKNIKQVDLAKKLNVSPSVIRDYENGSIAKFNKVFFKHMLRTIENS